MRDTYGTAAPASGARGPPAPPTPPRPQLYPDYQCILMDCSRQPWLIITMFTNSDTDAGTDAQVYLDLFGSRGSVSHGQGDD